MIIKININKLILLSIRYGSEDDTIITLIGNKIFSFIGKYFFSLPISDILYTFVLGKTKNSKP